MTNSEFIRIEDIPNYRGGPRGSKYDYLFKDVPLGLARKVTGINDAKTSYIRKMAHTKYPDFDVEVHMGILYIIHRRESKPEE